MVTASDCHKQISSLPSSLRTWWKTVDAPIILCVREYDTGLHKKISACTFQKRCYLFYFLCELFISFPFLLKASRSRALQRFRLVCRQDLACMARIRVVQCLQCRLFGTDCMVHRSGAHPGQVCRWRWQGWWRAHVHSRDRSLGNLSDDRRRFLQHP